jgi:ribosomal protein L37E
MSKTTCAKCGGRMEQGFVPEAKDHSTKVESWFEGVPQKRWWGLKTRGLRHLEIETWRCARCGFLESYAPG